MGNPGLIKFCAAFGAFAQLQGEMGEVFITGGASPVDTAEEKGESGKDKESAEIHISGDEDIGHTAGDGGEAEDLPKLDAFEFLLYDFFCFFEFHNYLPR
jgi:hypothetical protein